MFKENAKKVETIIKTSEEPQSSRLNGFQRLKECCFIVAVLSSVILAIALLTFSPADPSWSQTAWGGEINNAGGVLGAWLADTLFFTFGSLAYLIPVLITVGAWVVCRKRGEDEPIDLMLWGTRLLGLSILILTSCGLADINFDDIWYFSSGGVVGDVLSNLALPTFNVLGTTIVLLFLWGAGFTLLSGISWLTIVEWLGDTTLALMAALANKIRGSEPEVLEPQLDDYVEDTVADRRPEPEDEEEPLPHMTAYDVEEATTTPPAHEYPIYIPASGSVDDSAGSTVETQRPLAPLTDDPAPASDCAQAASPASTIDPTIERSRQLNVTIEELEQAARQADDWADVAHGSQEQAPQQIPEDPGSNVWEEATTWQETATLEEAGSVNLDIQSSQIPDTSGDKLQPAEPTLDSAALDDIAAEVLPGEHIEPTISNFDVLDDDVAEVTVPVETVTPDNHTIAQAAAVDEQPQSAVDVEEVNAEQDDDVAAFQNMVAGAQAKVAAQQNPFLVQQEENLPVPAEPLPTLELLYHPEKRENFIDRDALEQVARLVETKLADYKIKADVVGIYPGPVITRFELDLAPGVKVSRISGLSMDLARALSAMAVRVVEVIPGKPYVGLELPNMSRQTVYLSDVINSPQFEQATSPTTVVLGQDIAGEAVIADIAKMPHVLVAGTTGSGKSVGVNVMILSMLYKASPEDLRFIMIDPKMLELSIYEGIPHLLSEVVTDMKDASNALRWCVGEMERRYKLMSALGVRNVKGFNEKLKMAAEAGHPIHDPFWQEGDSMDSEPPLLEKLPYIVVVVDEFADLMMVVGKKVEELIARLAQKARAAGIHLILATQRPSVDVITGLIKANIPTRVAFTVSTKTDSRTILDQGGAESLLGMGDMLYLPPGSSHTTRVHGAFASDDDVHAVVNNWKARGKPNYIEEIISGDQGPESLLPGETMEADEDVDPLFDQVVEHVVQSRRGSVSGVQRRFKIGYNRAARIVEQLEAQGIVSAPGHNGNREVLAPAPAKD
ncbi:DNA translocase FtsK [Vibrio sp. CAU 1672]|uniref:DNA translocase FtsK n=1 Tax=Vibrio sp. CAU 1672 TaxID=3032594 RepID=UPI0023DA1BC3|nr:DNA translocase FtsK [Vibrio sp. CAU 1672]MDF2152506.1 DNA translocase FtsK 4TM domain-containing protein [Vibrio sp. CAU 1672]